MRLPLAGKNRWRTTRQRGLLEIVIHALGRGPVGEEGAESGVQAGIAWRDYVVPVAVAGAVGLFVVLRFAARTDLWLDEALTVDIARLPLATLPHALSEDGSPPLFYVLLHFWMGIFGSSTVAVRALPGIFGVGTLGAVWAAARRFGGHVAAWSAMIVTAASPFAAYYSTEVRMYSLVMLLVALELLALLLALEKPTGPRLSAVAVVTAALLYSHYWSIYLVATVGVYLVVRVVRRRGGLPVLLAVLGGIAAFMPWLPTFVFQAEHTGTPWRTHGGPGAVYSVMVQMFGGLPAWGRLLFVITAGLAVLGIAGRRSGRYLVELDMAGVPHGRMLAMMAGGVLAGGLAGGYVSNSAYMARYAAAAFIPLVLLAGRGASLLDGKWLRGGVLGCVVVSGYFLSSGVVSAARTQAGQVATALMRQAGRGDVITYCPDQLGPAVNRLLPGGRFDQVTFPRGTGPARIDWVDYLRVVASTSVGAFTAGLEASAVSGGHNMWVVWQPGYRGFGGKCAGIIRFMAKDSAFKGRVVVRAGGSYEPMGLYEFRYSPG